MSGGQAWPEWDGIVRWNGEPAIARKVMVVVGHSPVETWWCAPLEGKVRNAVEVDYHGEKFFLDNEDGSGWRKVTLGRGSPMWGHSSLPPDTQVMMGQSLGGAA